ncbi:sensor histidine kinase [Pseudobacter ginsenosidimutans]|uniref:histidine kinase n=1 Tax=Pseudobacter ginsenosidimutans TaxID=661488 RepID=A0A4Q7MVF7_9BACT|nr:HAMP domain-containing sensor histidine kinase [Pseudobacter ginsenosidimutans]QEC42077.1 HAMP domain-containing histidine kinase [Pseudobacter ginsenosidimutans]RZS71083.1 signal transduction histidine kinase [Pseudobacter ginsenosidimutans]
MNNLLNRSLKRFLLYSGLILIAGIPIYYLALSRLWQYELDEHQIILTPEARREDSLLIIGAVTILTVIFFALLLGGFILINRRISRQLWQPFYNTLERIRQFDLNRQQPVEFTPTDIAEFSRLNEALDKLLSANMATYHRQKEFADNASHELQTPIAIAQSKLEVLLQSQPLNDDQFEQIEEALNALSRVSRINKNLLLLTKIENNQYADLETIKLSALVTDILQMLENFLEEKNLRLTTSVQENIEVQGNRILVEILVQNLINNIIRHSPEGSSISISLNKHLLQLTNAGTSPLDAGRLFMRFATTGSHAPGTGLGLAIVKQIADRYRWKIDYQFQNNNHIFSIQF